MRILKRLGLALLALLVLAALTLALVLWRASAPLPTERTPGPQADALARRIQAAVALPTWERTEAVAWRFAGRQTHLWDRRRQLARVEFGPHAVLLDLSNREGVAWRHGQLVEGPALRGLLDQAWAHWINDSFWLYPFATFFDPGVSRALAPGPDGAVGLLVSYGSGGVTPGDHYLWSLDAQDRPTAWRMWVSILPVGGLRASWEAWETHGGVPFATRHAAGLTLAVEILGAGSLAEVAPGPDPFAQIASAPLAAPDPPTSQPTAL